ncbi:MAG: cytochrome c peroxidase [Saprospiraceae bacterium]|nr:cytochrome c peroxidase [Saprospiraceae bacterium]
MKNVTAFICLLFCLLVFFSCEKERNLDDYSNEEYALISQELTLPQVVNSYQLELKEHFLPPGKTYPKVNTVSFGDIYSNNNKATLGRVLFYDKTLSLDRNVSCGSCHHPERAFSDDKQFSEGVGEVITKRNTLALATTLSFKISYSPIDPSLSRSKFSWDDSAADLPQQVKNAFLSENEMNIEEEEIKQRISERPFYSILFKKAFGTDEVNSDRIAESISAFVDAISSVNSKFDKGLESAALFSVDKDFYNFTAEENEGKKLYNANCASCHTDKHNFTVKATANNGLEMEYSDNGIGGRLNDPDFYGVFKIPFLRNIELTAPYMHDGRFETLEEVVDHYSEGIVNHSNLSDELKDENGNPLLLNFNQEEKSALVAYLKTLTDKEVTSDEKFLDPFKG